MPGSARHATLEEGERVQRVLEEVVSLLPVRLRPVFESERTSPELSDRELLFSDVSVLDSSGAVPFTFSCPIFFVLFGFEITPPTYWCRVSRSSSPAERPGSFFSSIDLTSTRKTP